MAGEITRTGVYNFSNGLSKLGSNVKLGGLLSENTTIGLNGFTFTIGDLNTSLSVDPTGGNFTTDNGNGLNIGNDFAKLSAGSDFYKVYLDVVNSRTEIYAIGGNYRYLTGANPLDIDADLLTTLRTQQYKDADGIFQLENYLGKKELSTDALNPNLANDGQFVYYNDGSGKYELKNAVSNATNGLTNNLGVVELGGALTKTTNITGAFQLNFGTVASKLSSINNRTTGANTQTVYGTETVTRTLNEDGLFVNSTNGAVFELDFTNNVFGAQLLGNNFFGLGGGNYEVFDSLSNALWGSAYSQFTLDVNGDYETGVIRLGIQEPTKGVIGFVYDSTVDADLMNVHGHYLEYDANARTLEDALTGNTSSNWIPSYGRIATDFALLSGQNTFTGSNQNNIISNSGIKLGNNTQTAAAAGAGSLRYNSGLEVSDGTTWSAVSGGGGGSVSLTTNRIAFGSATNTVTESADFTWNDTTKVFNVNGAITGLATQNLFNTGSTTINFGGGATTGIVLGTTVGTLAIQYPIITGAANASLWSTSTSPTLFNAGTSISIGATSGTTTIRNTTVTLSGTTLNINGANPTITSTNTGTASVFNTNVSVMNFAGSASTINMGASTSSYVLNGSSIQLPGTINFASGSTTLTGWANATSATMFSATATQTINIATGVTGNGNTKTINIGKNSGTGSTTLVEIGSTSVAGGATSTVNLAGTVGLFDFATLSYKSVLQYSSNSIFTIGNAWNTAIFGTNTINASNATLSFFNTTTTTLTGFGAVTTGNIFGSTGALTLDIGSGATLTSTTKTINIGGNGVAGSTTNINIGSLTSTTSVNSFGTLKAKGVNTSSSSYSFWAEDSTNDVWFALANDKTMQLKGNLYRYDATATFSTNFFKLSTLSGSQFIEMNNTNGTVGQNAGVIMGKTNTATDTTAAVLWYHSNAASGSFVDNKSLHRFTYFDTGGTSELFNIYKNRAVFSNTVIIGDSTGTDVAGMIRYNANRHQFYNGTSWHYSFGIGQKELDTTALNPSSVEDGYGYYYNHTTGKVGLKTFATTLKANATITEAGSNWSSNTNYTQTITVTGAAVGDVVTVNVDDSVYTAALTAGGEFTLRAWVTSANTVKVWSRVSSFTSVPAATKYYVVVHK